MFAVSLGEDPKVDFGAVNTIGLVFHDAVDWYVNISKVQFGNISMTGAFRALVDTGTSFTALPTGALEHVIIELETLGVTCFFEELYMCDYSQLNVTWQEVMPDLMISIDDE